MRVVHAQSPTLGMKCRIKQQGQELSKPVLFFQLALGGAVLQRVRALVARAQASHGQCAEQEVAGVYSRCDENKLT